VILGRRLRKRIVRIISPSALIIGPILFRLVLAGNSAGEDPLVTNQLLKAAGREAFALGQVQLDKANRSVTFPITLNRLEGPMEYLLVTSHGKIHESIFRTEAKPEEIHIAMLLLGATETGTNSTVTPSQGPVSNPSKQILKGDPLAVTVKWKANGKDMEHPAEGMILNSKTGSTLKPGNWVYNGSVIWQGKFIASLEGSIVALITDQTALINNIAEGHDNDQIWTVSTNALPPAGVELQMSFRLTGTR
jgi:hypothetical protein